MRAMRLCRIAVAVVVALWLAGPSPAGATDLRAVLTDYTVTSWGEKDGFPLGNTWAIAQDEHGYLWLGTDAGLFRFDGVRFLPWTPPTRHAAPKRFGPLGAGRARRQLVDWLR